MKYLARKLKVWVYDESALKNEDKNSYNVITKNKTQSQALFESGSESLCELVSSYLEVTYWWTSDSLISTTSS